MQQKINKRQLLSERTSNGKVNLPRNGGEKSLKETKSLKITDVVIDHKFLLNFICGGGEYTLIMKDDRSFKLLVLLQIYEHEDIVRDNKNLLLMFARVRNHDFFFLRRDQ